MTFFKPQNQSLNSGFTGHEQVISISLIEFRIYPLTSFHIYDLVTHPEAIKISQIHPELRLAYAALLPLPAHKPAFVKPSNRAMKFLRPPSPLEGLERQVHLVAASGLEVRVFYPVAPTQNEAGLALALLWIHGGGMIMGCGGTR